MVQYKSNTDMQYDFLLEEGNLLLAEFNQARAHSVDQLENRLRKIRHQAPERVQQVIEDLKQLNDDNKYDYLMDFSSGFSLGQLRGY